MAVTRISLFVRPAAAVLGLLTLAAASLVVAPASAHPGSPALHRSPAHAGSGYVALGDSYAAGEGLAPFVAGTEGPGGCHRSAKQSYPAVLAGTGQRSFARPVSVACSGAVTADLVTTRAGSARPPQIAALDPRTETVTVTIGGNDTGFGLIFGDCVYSPDSTLQAALPGDGPGCETRDDTEVSTRIAALSGAPDAPSVPGIVPLPVLLAQIDAVSPRATIYLTGYPSMFGTRTSNAAGCRVSSVAPLYVARSDAAWIRSKATELNATIRSAAATARTRGVDVRFVDVAKSFRGHNLCDRKTPWLNGVVLASTAPPELSPATFHPTARGQRAYAKAVLKTADHRHRWSHGIQPRP
jgi:lysophospholipase L1-like esterase